MRLISQLRKCKALTPVQIRQAKELIRVYPELAEKAGLKTVLCNVKIKVDEGCVPVDFYHDAITVQDIKDDFVNMINDTDVNAFEPYNYQYSVNVPAHGLDYYIDVDVDGASYVIEAQDNDTLVVTGAESGLV